MKRKSFMKNLKAVSPVIATIIIVAIAIVMAIAVAYWMLGLGGAFTRYEKLEIPTAYATVGTNKFTITMVVKNTGSATATIDNSAMLFNGKPADAYSNSYRPAISPNNPTLDPGAQVPITIDLPYDNTDDACPWKNGMTVEIMIHTVAGKDYPKVIVLP